MLKKYIYNNDMRGIIRVVLPFAVTAAAFLILNSNHLAETLYIAERIASDETQLIFVRNIEKCVKAACITMISICYLSPIIQNIRDIHSTNLIYKRQQIIVVSAAEIIFELMLLYMIVISRFVGNFNLYALENFYTRNSYVLYITVIVFIAVVVAIMYVLLKFHIFGEEFIQRKYYWNKKCVALSDIQDVFHSFKNIVFAMQILKEKAVDYYGTEESLNALAEIDNYICKLRTQLNQFMVICNRTRIQFKTVDVDGCVREAINRLNTAKNPEINYNPTAHNMSVYGDSLYIEEMIYNLLSNAVEAVAYKGDAGKIEIKIVSEPPWVGICIRDNGEGMDRKKIKKIFRPFYTTKKTLDNWGMGLAYVKNVSDLHAGFVNVESEPGNYTEFQVILPSED
ncbi:MAG: ATP-binding protein [Clostridiales bacterium]|nr:ATP-binding protein [Clostridiales bacterium]